MTSKSLPNKITKVNENPERLRAQRRSFEVIKHFDPSSNACSLYAKIPIINISDEEETKIVDIHVNRKRNLFSSKRQGLGGRQQRITRPSSLHHNAKARKPKPSTLQSSLSSSVKQSINLVKMKSKTFHLGNPRKTLHKNEGLKSAIEESLLKSASSNLKSVAEPVVIRKELTLQSLKQEILENKKNFPKHRDKFEILNLYKNDSLIKNLKAEILKVKTNNFLHKKMLITELRSEISQYKQFNKFQVYKNHEESSRNQRQNCNADGKKFKNSYEGDEVMQNYDGKENSLEKGNKKCGLDGSKEASFDGNSKTCSREPNAIRTDIDSTSDLTDRSSESIIDTTDIPKSPIRMVLDAVFMDDEVIKYKIAQADQLLKRVKKALVRIKSIQPCDDFAIEVKSGSTDNEETIDSFRDRESKSLQHRNKSKCFTCSNLNKSEESDILKVARPVEIAFTFNPNIEASGSSKECCGKYRLNKEDMDSERPTIRRIEAEMGRLEISSSLQQFQIKLQTISQATESNDSTPRKRSDCSQIVHQLSNKNCTIKPLPTENIDIPQVVPCQNTTMGVCYSCPREEKEIQTTKALTADMATEMFNSDLKQTKDTQTTLQMQNLKSQEIFYFKRKCSSCNIECLPMFELMPSKYICQGCQHILKHEDLQGRGGASVGFKAEKLKKLKIQIMPPIIIKPALTLIQTLNLSIDPIGKSKNYVRNTDNLLFVETKRLIENQMPLEAILPRSAKNNDVTKEELEDVEELNNFADQDLVKDELEAEGDDENTLSAENALKSQNKMKCKIRSDIVDDNKTYNGQIWKMILSTNSAQEFCTEMEKVVAKEINADEEFVNKMHPNREGERSVDDIVKSLHSAQMENEEMRRKRPWYKSHNTYNSPNKHDLEELDQKSLEKLSEVDAEFYKTLVSPDTKMCEELTASISKYKLMGFESKTVQCDQQMTLAALESCKPEEPNKITINLLPPRTNDNNSVMDVESEAIVLRLSREIPFELEASPLDIIQSVDGSYLEKNESSSPSQIPITYSSSLEEKIGNNVLKNYTDNDNQLTNSDGEELIASDVESKHRDLQVTSDTFAVSPQYHLRRYSLDISNSDTVTTNSISEGEVLCKHSLSNGEIHACHR
ncbi:uncharacterized protein [Euwallacea similis]|uniref:uncharacterized protein isoform X2 n=1 Tax=Euwallacea similis TaxID=1736056 RepID=UPI00344E1012